MSNYLAENTNLVSKLQSKEYVRKDLEKVVSEYNEFITSGIAKANLVKADPPAQVLSESISAKKIEQLIQFESMLKASTSVTNKSEAEQIFKDFSSKLKAKENIPNYLINALRSTIESDKALSELLEEILKP
uniref:hypothetical protein n=1 Tax=Roseivirga sp. TaxID=1964215 RepID=UPI0040471442